LLGLLDLEEVGPDVFLGQHRPGEMSSRTFGGQLISQGMVAAGRTVKDGLPIHAVNAHFIRGGDVGKPIEYRVDRHRDARVFANRTVTAYQGDDELFVMLVAFQDWSPGLEHAAAVPVVPDPEGLPRIDDHFVGYEDKLQMFITALRPTDLRYTNDPAWVLKSAGETLAHNRVWMRADGELPDDPLSHVAALGHSSDTTVLDSIITTHGLSWGFDRIMAATVNHSIWFHRPFRFDEWMLYSTESPVAAGSRGLATGRFYSRDGELCVTVVQEGVIKYYPARR
jgi:acyl-CoA thioesterase-2